MSDPALLFERVDNFRDYGGYATPDGGRLRSNWLFRSASLHEATATDMRRLVDLGVQAIVDIRGPHERTRHPMPGVEAQPPWQFFHTSVETGALAPHIEVALKGVRNVEEARATTCTVFADMPCRPVIIEALRNYFSAVAQTNGPSVVHCAVGKDRTGVAVALLQTALGVHADDVMDDFLLTNTIGNHEERLAVGVLRMRSAFGAHLSEAAARTLVTVHPSYLHAAFDAIESTYGSIETYLHREVGMDDVLREQLVRRLVI